MKRRQFIRKAAAGAAAASVFSGIGQVRADRKRRPNVVVIIADDTGWNDVAYNGSEIRTPVLDRMAENGVRLDANYVYPTCSPTRAALLTGRPPSRFGILGPIAMKSTLTLPRDQGTLASVLSDAGYDTALAGKWHLGLKPEVGPNSYGFKESYGYLHGQIDQYTHIYKNGDRSWHRNGTFIDEEGHATDLIADEAVKYIETDRDNPFFLYVAFSVPHYPLQEDERWTDGYSNITNESRRLFAASMTHMDRAVGRILSALKEQNIEKETLIIFTSDNGGQENWYPTFEYNGKFKANDRLGSNRPLKGWKADLYEGGIRVPAIWYWPGTLKPGNVSEPVIAWDTLPTVAGLCDAEIPEAVEGTDVWQAISRNAGLPERTFYWRTPGQIAVRRGRWKLIHNGASPDEGSSELYDVITDPYETTDLSIGNTEKKSEMTALLNEQYRHDTDI